MLPMPPATKTPTQRKRIRKRKRRVASPSSSSLSNSSLSDSSENDGTKTSIPPSKVIASAAGPSPSLSSDSDSFSSSSEEKATHHLAQDTSTENQRGDPQQQSRQPLSPSPSPPPTCLPSFLPTKDDSSPDDAQKKEQDLKARFRQFWMAAVADGFRDDLEQIRKEPNLGKSRLELLINSLVSGADVFSSSSSNTGVNEMDLVLS